MNHRILFIFSAIIIVIALFGIFSQRNAPAPQDVVAKAPASTTRSATIAVARHDLAPYQILTSQDYQLRTITTNADSHDAREISLSGSTGLNGYLLHNSISQGSAILPAVIESPDSPKFLLHSLRENELPYGISIKKTDAFLLNSLNIGDRVSIYLRTIDPGRSHGKNVISGPDGTSSSSQSLKKYVINRLTAAVTVIGIERAVISKDAAYGENNNAAGTIILRVNQQQLTKLKVVEKSGDMLLLPVENNPERANQAHMDDVLPQYRSIKELRGGK